MAKRKQHNITLPPSPDELVEIFRNEAGKDDYHLYEQKKVRSRIFSVSEPILRGKFNGEEWSEDLRELSTEVLLMIGEAPVKSVKGNNLTQLIGIAAVVILLILGSFFGYRWLAAGNSQAGEDGTRQVENEPAIAVDTTGTESDSSAISDIDTLSIDTVAMEPSVKEAAGNTQPIQQPVAATEDTTPKAPDSKPPIELTTDPTFQTEEEDSVTEDANLQEETTVPVEDTSSTADNVSVTDTQEAAETTPVVSSEVPLPEGGLEALKQKIRNISADAAAATIVIIINEDGSINRTRISGVSSETESTITSILEGTKWRPAVIDGAPTRERLRFTLE